MPNTPRMKFPYPSFRKDPWYDDIEAFFNAVDASAYAQLEDRNVLLLGGGTVTWLASTLTWSETIYINSATSGFLWRIPPATINLAVADCLFVDLVRYPPNNIDVAVTVASQVPSEIDALLLAMRFGDNLFWRHGTVMPDGYSGELFITATAPQSLAQVLGVGNTTNGEDIVLSAGGVLRGHESHDLSIIGAVPATGNARDLVLQAATPDQSGRDGGSVQISAGDGRTTGAGGDIDIAAGTSPSGSVGTITLSGDTSIIGAVDITGTLRVSDDVTLHSGAALHGAATDNLVIRGLPPATGHARDVHILAAEPDQNARNGGDIKIVAGAAKTTGTGGTIVLVAGESPSGTSGTIELEGPTNVLGDAAVDGNLTINGKLTVSGVIDPTALILEEAPAPATTATQGALFVSDGSGGLDKNEPYYRPASDAPPVKLGGGGGGPLGQRLTVALNAAVDNTGGGTVTLRLGEFAFDSSEFPASTFELQVVLAVSSGLLTGTASLYNVSDAEYVSLSGGNPSTNSTNPTEFIRAMAAGGSPGELQDSRKLYAVEVSVTGGSLPSDLCYLGSAFIEVTPSP